MKPPTCKLCGKAHWTYEEHDTSALEEVRKLGASVLRNPAINGKERLTDAINAPAREGDKPPGVLPVQVVRESVPDAQAPPLLLASARTPNRRSRESYNTYMKTYMRAYRARSRG